MGSNHATNYGTPKTHNVISRCLAKPIFILLTVYRDSVRNVSQSFLVYFVSYILNYMGFRLWVDLTGISASLIHNNNLFTRTRHNHGAVGVGLGAWGFQIFMACVDFHMLIIHQPFVVTALMVRLRGIAYVHRVLTVFHKLAGFNPPNVKKTSNTCFGGLCYVYVACPRSRCLRKKNKSRDTKSLYFSAVYILFLLPVPS